VMELAGFDRIATVEGDARTLKITHPADIATAAFYLTSIDN
ncbi:MAG: 2-C-methyl-D-erythritol 4-phosphate cytidylyltransferase, partial [Paramuribaculum sp.]|nr:2-C-methyl-D-erythritol 4-phosphate cytidylyltransferase [Paramuribaculum sp.]